MDIHTASYRNLFIAILAALFGAIVAVFWGNQSLDNLIGVTIFIAIFYLIIVNQVLLFFITKKNIVFVSHGVPIPNIKKLSLDKLQSIEIRRYDRNKIQELGESWNEDIDRIQIEETEVATYNDTNKKIKISKDCAYVVILKTKSNRVVVPVFLFQHPERLITSILKK